MENPTNFKGKGVLKWSLTIGLVIVLNLFFSVAIQVVFPQPEYENFCEQKQTRDLVADENSCLEVGGQWNPTMPVKESEITGYCNEQFTCSQNYEDAQKDYTQNVFVVLIVLGVLALIAGYFVRIAPAVSAGLSYGGVLTFIIASLRYWGAAGDLARLAIVGVALIALIVIGVKKFKE